MMKVEAKQNTVTAARPYANVEDLRRNIEQEPSTNPAYWYTFHGRPRVKEVKFDWLRRAWNSADLELRPPVLRKLQGDYI